MKKNDQRLVFDKNIPIKKMDDWSRRTFVKRLGLFMTAFGVPWLTRIETMSKISKKIFGNSLAFAAGGQKRWLISLRFRAGWFANSLFCLKRDSEVATLNRNVHPGPNTVIKADSGGGRFLYLSPQGAPLAGLDPVQATQNPPVLAPNPVNTTNYADRILYFHGTNADGHTNMFRSSTGGTGYGPDFTAALCSQQNAIASPLLPMTLVAGSQTDTNYSNIGALSGEYSPLYGQALSDFTGMFDTYQMTPPDGQVVEQTVSDNVIDAVSLADDNYLAVLEEQGRGGIEALRSNISKLKSLLSAGLVSTLTPTQAHRDAILGTGATAVPDPVSNFNTVVGNNDPQALADFFIFAGLCAANGVASAFGLTINTSDHHGNIVQPGDPNAGTALDPDEPNNNTMQARHAATLAQLFANAMNAFDNNPLFVDTTTGEQIGLGMTITGESEFSRTCQTNGGDATTPGDDDGDGGSCFGFALTPSGCVNGGTYGNRNDSNRYTSYDPDTGAETGSTSLLDPTYVYGTLATAAGIDMSSIVRNLNYVTAAF